MPPGMSFGNVHILQQHDRGKTVLNMPIKLYKLCVPVKLLRMQRRVAALGGHLLHSVSFKDLSQSEWVQVLRTLRVSLPLMPERVQMLVLRVGVPV